jgi:hypothetical protein
LPDSPDASTLFSSSTRDTYPGAGRSAGGWTGAVAQPASAASDAAAHAATLQRHARRRVLALAVRVIARAL